MRNPMNSWDRFDSRFDGEVVLGHNELKLAQKLAKGGGPHAKFRRMIQITMDVTAPLYWWKEFDTYKVGTVANSCSTMHKIHDKEFTIDDFSHEHLISAVDLGIDDLSEFNIDKAPFVVDKNGKFYSPTSSLNLTIKMLNKCRKLYLETNDKQYWWQLIQLLPSSYNQKRTLQFNYEVASQIYYWRKDHKLDEWHTFVKDGLMKLPYFVDLIVIS
jgi:hypothetical protein